MNSPLKDKATITTEALKIAKARLNAAPTFALYQSIVAQLEYLKGVIEGHEKNKARLNDIVVGVYAVKDFEESDPEFAAALKDAQYVASRMARGLKV